MVTDFGIFAVEICLWNLLELLRLENIPFFIVEGKMLG